MTPGTTILERYFIESILGEGGMGVVLRARHVTLGHTVAVKVMTIEHPEASRRFLLEARAMAAVRSPHVASVIDYGMHEDNPVLVMEFIKGESLEDRLKRVGALTWDFAFRLASEVALGLAAIHDAQLLHRDIKPANIMLEQGQPERARIVDFGIAKQLGPDAQRMTNTGVVIGTPAYMSPEQMLGTELGSASDIYSLGTMLWEMICGGSPFGDEYADALKRMTSPPPPLVLPAGLPAPPASACAAVLELLATDPQHREPRGREVARRLISLAQGQQAPATAQPSPGGTALAPRLRDQSGPLIAVARLPAHALRDREQRLWLTSLIPPAARSYTLGALWFALYPPDPEPAEPDPALSNETERELLGAFVKRYGNTVSVRVRRAPRSFRLSPSALAGAGQLPEFLAEMLGSI